MHISYALVCSTEAEPKDILGEIFHFDAQDIDANGLIDSSIWDGNKVSEWRDIANGNHATQNNSSQQPKFFKNAINKKGAIKFDGKDDILKIPDHSDINTGWPYPERSLASVFKTGNDINTFQTIYEEWWWTRWYSFILHNSHIYAWVWNKSEWDTNHKYKSVDLWTVQKNTVYFTMMVQNSSHYTWNISDKNFIDNENTLAIYINGKLAESQNGESIQTHVDPQYSHPDDIGIWGINKNTVRASDNAVIKTAEWDYFKWHIWELISWNHALDQDEIDQIQNYFSDKWWISLFKEISKVTKISSDNTPDYSFYVNKNGTLKYNGWCKWNTSEAYEWTNTITLSENGNGKALSNWEYNDCSIELKDSEWNTSTLQISSFEINTNLKSLSVINPIETTANDNTPTYTFYSPISGNIVHSWNCFSNTSQAVIGNNTITFNQLSDGSYYNCSTKVQNFSEWTTYLKIPPFKIDTKIPIITEISPIDPDDNYAYSFHINENGIVNYGGSCSVKVSEERCMWNNKVFFYELEWWSYDDCTIGFTDSAGNISENTVIEDLIIEWWVSYITENGIHFWALKTSNIQRDIIVDYALQSESSFLEIDDLDSNSNGYYLTVQSSNIISWGSTIDKNNISISMETILAKNENNEAVDEIDIPPGLYNRWSGFKKIGTPLVVLERKKEKKGKVGKYKIKPKLKITIPPYQTLGNYTGTITYTLIEN